ncbi:MAG: Ig-like domain-containing protein, partial [Candidatus Methylomirabilia bacterium]
AVTTFLPASAQLTLVAPTPSAAADAGYQIDVKARDAWLTADGKSQTRVTATVTMAGKGVEGHKINFKVSGVGSVRAVNDTTNRNGEATAIYTAGKKIGIVMVSAEDPTVGISGSVAIELRSDAPAKINIGIKPDSLPADGRSTADLLVQVTDINDNPNDGAEVEYVLVGGSGRLREDKGVTDRRGESTNEYVAGRTPGIVTFELTVRSTLPTSEEKAKAEDLALLPSDNQFF